MEHLALTIFSICVQAAIGIMIFVAIGRLLNKEKIFKNATIAATVLGIVGAVASLMHLGKPFSAIKALYQFGSSWLSREIWFTAIFILLAILMVVLIYAKPQNKSAISGLAAAAAVVGLIDVFFMAAIYSSSSVPFWQSIATLVEFYAATLSMGAILFLLLSIKEIAEMATMKKIIALAVALAVILQVAAVVPSLIALGASSSAAAHSSLAILGNMAVANAFKWIFILAGALLLLWMVKDELSKLVTNIVLSSTILLLVGQIVGRYLFYAAMVVTGVGLS
ncbi:MAG: dimethyl sulfoxide reductase anchor subunit [Peptococcaceae bacterium]|jgi:anaerobic dimethyl sulfoxide reductase subunit C (anchor subunit)|nr:dimethyl sulfoxide reductase anchor subunit [Peptococcaceae bacterium]